jgi:hypothetical protein
MPSARCLAEGPNKISLQENRTFRCNQVFTVASVRVVIQMRPTSMLKEQSSMFVVNFCIHQQNQMCHNPEPHDQKLTQNLAAGHMILNKTVDRKLKLKKDSLCQDMDIFIYKRLSHNAKFFQCRSLTDSINSPYIFKYLN